MNTEKEIEAIHEQINDLQEEISALKDRHAALTEEKRLRVDLEKKMRLFLTVASDLSTEWEQYQGHCTEFALDEKTYSEQFPLNRSFEEFLYDLTVWARHHNIIP